MKECRKMLAAVVLVSADEGVRTLKRNAWVRPGFMVNDELLAPNTPVGHLSASVPGGNHV